VFITLSEITLLRTQRLTLRLATALLVGICGVAVLMSHSASLTEVPVNRAGAASLLIAAVTWSIATILTTRIPLPASKPMSAAAQMLTGGIQLFIVAAISGEMRGFHFDSVSTGLRGSRLFISSLPDRSPGLPRISGCCIMNRRPKSEPMRTSIRWWQLRSAISWEARPWARAHCWELCLCS
jgi:hypothetical protein